MATISSLASDIASQAKALSDLLDKHNVAQPTFAESGANDFEESVNGLAFDDDLAIRTARADLINKARQLQDLAHGPSDQVLGLAFSSTDISNLAVIIRFEIPQAIPLGGSISAKDLADKVGLPHDELQREVRFAIGNGIFTEPEADVFAHSSVSARLAKNEHLRNIAAFCTYDMAPILVRTSESLKLKQQNGWKTPIAAFNTAHPEYEDAFEWFHKDHAANERYHTYLNGRINTSRWAMDKFANVWDWASVGSGTIIDCGGSVGHSLMAIAPKAPQAKLIVQDMNIDAMALGRKLVSQDAAFSGRIDFVEHDFFKPQDITADVYIFRHIIHDWGNEDSVKILSALIPALKDGARVLISEGVMPEPPAKRSVVLDDKQIRIEDAYMLSGHNARERSVAEYTELFKAASPKFEFVGVSGTKDGAFQSLVEYVYKA